MTFEQLFNLSLLELIKLAMMDDIVLFIRLWPLWGIISILSIIIFILGNK